MKLEHIVGLAVRLFSIALAVYILRDAISLVPYFREQGWNSVSYSYLALMISLLFLSVYLWYFPLAVSKRLVTFREAEGPKASSVTAEEVQTIGFTILGMYFLFNVLSDVVYWLTVWFLSSRNHGIPMNSPWDQIPSIVTTGIEFVFALGLLFGASGLTKFIRKIRS